MNLDTSLAAAAGYMRKVQWFFWVLVVVCDAVSSAVKSRKELPQ